MKLADDPIAAVFLITVCIAICGFWWAVFRWCDTGELPAVRGAITALGRGLGWMVGSAIGIGIDILLLFLAIKVVKALWLAA